MRVASGLPPIAPCSAHSEPSRIRDRTECGALENPLFLKPVTHPINRFDHVEGVVDCLEFISQALDVTVDTTIIDINVIIVPTARPFVTKLAREA
jgi:hypothetical protein